MYEIWKQYVGNYSSYRVRTKALTKISCYLDLWPLDPKIYKYLPFAILHLCMKYESCTLKITQVIMSETMCWQSSTMILTFDLFILYRYLPLTILHLCIKFESCTLKTTQVIESEPKYCQNSVVTLTFELLAPKCIGIVLLTSCICVNMKAVCSKILKLSCQNQSVDKVQLWPWPFDPKMYRYLPLAILHLCMKYESCMLKTTEVIMLELKCWQTDGQIWFL